MNRFIILCLLMSAAASAAAKKKAEKEEDKIYTIGTEKPGVQIGASKNAHQDKPSHPAVLYFIGLSRGSLAYHLPAFVAETRTFSPSFAGINFGEKQEDVLFLCKGNREISGEWQRFKRESGTFSQKLDIYQINIFQNLNLPWSVSNSVFFTAGLGAAPLYITAEQSGLGNSVSEFGFMGMIKFDAVFPFQKNYQFDIALKSGWGHVAHHNLFLTTLGAGVSFE